MGCGTCSRENRPDPRSCDGCGASIASAAASNVGVDTVASKIHRFVDHAILVTISRSDRRAAGERWRVQHPTVAVERDGRVTDFGTWEPESMGHAVERFDELRAIIRTCVGSCADGGTIRAQWCTAPVPAMMPGWPIWMRCWPR